MSIATVSQPKLFPSTELDWTFQGENTRQLTHCYHDYPARMIPQVARQFLEIFTENKKGVLLDPYCGTGTTLVEGFINGFDVIGFDLNPLARLIAKAKTTILNLPDLDFFISKFNKYILAKHQNTEIPEIKGISRLEFWFKPEVVEKLSIIKKFIQEIENTEIKLFFLTAFSETVRESSNTRTHEFKLYRYNEATLANFQPNVFELMSKKLLRNRKGFLNFLTIINETRNNNKSEIFEFNTVKESPSELNEKVDIVLTSPPYGDSTTTVAYGQYSRLSAAWLDLFEPEKIDSKLMGSKKRQQFDDFACENLDIAITKIAEIDLKRATEVSSFYIDLQESVKNISKLVKSNGLACYVVGNRKVKGVILPTDIAVKTFFEQNNFKYINTFHREIPNKRMPLRNSPSNIIGKTENTMNQEYIVVMKKL
jgi:site-specific DNA-methyltransferase (cytosine-N4-specific)